MAWISFFNKWLHLLSVIGMMGGVLFAWLVLLPVLREGSEGGDIAKRLWKRTGISLAVLWVLVLATGFFNMYVVTYAAVRPVNAEYQMILGMKMSLAIVMFLLTLLVAHPPAALQQFIKGRAGLLFTLLVLGIVVVGISAHLNISRVNGTGLKASPPSQALQTAPP